MPTLDDFQQLTRERDQAIRERNQALRERDDARRHRDYPHLCAAEFSAYRAGAEGFQEEAVAAATWYARVQPVVDAARAWQDAEHLAGRGGCLQGKDCTDACPVVVAEAAFWQAVATCWPPKPVAPVTPDPNVEVIQHILNEARSKISRGLIPTPDGLYREETDDELRVRIRALLEAEFQAHAIPGKP